MLVAIQKPLNTSNLNCVMIRTVCTFTCTFCVQLTIQMQIISLASKSSDVNFMKIRNTPATIGTQFVVSVHEFGTRDASLEMSTWQNYTIDIVHLANGTFVDRVRSTLSLFHRSFLLQRGHQCRILLLEF